MSGTKEVIFLEGLEANLPTTGIIDGAIYVCTDSGKTYLGTSSTTMVPLNIVEASSNNGKIKINGTDVNVYTHPGSGTNPHGTTKTDVGLGNVGNFKAVSTVANQGLTDTEKSNARANIGAGTSNLTIGTTSTTAAAGNHTHATSIATSTGTSQITLQAGGKYSITAGGTTYIFTMPSDTNTNQTVKAGSTTFGANDAIDIVAGSNVTVTPDATNKKITIAATDTTYESKAAASGGTDESLVTTGEKYTWNSKAAGNHTHTLSLASGGTSTVNLAANTAYTLTAGGSTLVFKTPADGNTDAKQKITTATTTKAYITGVTATNYSSGTAYEGLADTGVYLTTNAGELQATNFVGKHSGYTLAAACAKGVDTSIIAGSTSTNLPTTAAVETRLESFLAKSGGTMTGALTLSGAPTADLHAATKKYVDDSITALPEPMVFKGSLGTGGTITSLPTASASNEGFTYKVITAGTYASQTAKVGDTFISDGSTWVLIPSGDEPSGTVTSITLKATSPIAIDSTAAITTSGTRTLSHANSGATAGSYGDSSAQTPAYGATFKVPYITVNATGHVTAISEHTVKIPASDNTTYSAGTGLTLSGTTFNHSNSITAGTVGTSSATSGSTLAVPYVTYDAQGHITATGTHTHTVSGFLPSSGGTITGDLTRKASNIDASKANNNVTTTQYPTTFTITDTANRILTRKEAIIESNGNISAFWYCRNYNTSGTMVTQKGIKITVNKAGTATYVVSDGANFRSAIGAGTSNLTIGTTSTTAAAGDHTHAITLVSGGTSTVNLAANTAYTLTAGGSTLVFKTPADGNTDTKVKQSGTATANWRKILTGYQNDATAGTAVTEVTETAFVNAGFEFQASTGTVRATNFTGKHSGYTLAAACAKGVDTSITAGTTSTNLPTSKAVNDFAVANQSDWNENDTTSPAFIKNRTHYYGPQEFGYVELFTSGTTGNPHYIPPYAYSGNSLDGSHTACALGARYRITLTPQSSYSGDWAGTYTFVATTLNNTDYTRGGTIANGRFAIYTQGTGSSISWYIAATDAQYGGVNLYCNIKVEYDASYYLTAENVNVPSSISSFYPTGSSTNVAVACKLETKKYYDIVINGVTYSDIQPFETSDYVYVGSNSYTLSGYLIFTDTGTPNNNTWVICWSPDYYTLTPASAVSSMSDVSFSIKYSENQKVLLDPSWIDGYVPAESPFPAESVGTLSNPIYWDGNDFVPTNVIYGECSDSASTVTKNVYYSPFTLTEGATIHIKFTYTNTASSPKLRVNNSTAAYMYLYGTTKVGTTVATSWPAGSVVTFTYSNGSWYMNDYQESTPTNLSMGNAYGTCSTAAATTTKTVSLSGFTLANYGRIAVSFTNDVPASSWLNVNSTGAKKIYYN